MRKIGYLVCTLVFLSSCSAHKKTVSISNKEAHRNNVIIQQQAVQHHAEQQQQQQQAVQQGQPTAAAIADFKPYTSLAYIERFKAIAIQEMNLYGIPASITLAQGLFESGSGNSDLARYANNHFGIKCTSDWKGRSYYKDDDNVNDCFRVYDNPEDSFRDHSQFLKRKNYARLFELDKNDYEGWANGLKQAGYATNPKYPQLLINIIVKYNLDQYDRPEGEVQKIKREDRVLTQINNTINKPAKDTLTQASPDDKIYSVKTGDTLYNISKRFGITVDELRALNRLPDNHISIGQKLVVVK